MKVIYEWPAFRLVFDTETGETITHYPRQRWSGCVPHDDDAFHAERLGITPAEHRLEHELAHHLIGLYCYYSLGEGSPVIWRDAHHEPQPEREAEIEEWMVTALQYFAHRKVCDLGAVADIEQVGGVLLAQIAAQLNWLRDTPRYASLVEMIPTKNSTPPDADKK